MRAAIEISRVRRGRGGAPRRLAVVAELHHTRTLQPLGCAALLVVRANTSSRAEASASPSEDGVRYAVQPLESNARTSACHKPLTRQESSLTSSALPCPHVG